MSPAKPKGKTSQHLRSAMPLIKELVRPRRKLLGLGFFLMLINRGAGLVLPGSTKYLVDNVIVKQQVWLLKPLVLAVFIATLVQGATSFTLTQLLSKEAQRLIAQLRRKVQEHVGRLPVAYYDANKSGVLVSRIMSDVEGVRNLVGTGLVEFVGGILTAVFSLIFLLRISPLMTSVALLFIGTFALVLRKAFGGIRPIFRERGKITAEVTGRLTESLSGVRVVKGYHAESEEAEVFSGGVERLLNNVIKSLTAISLMSLSATTLMGIVGATVMFLGARQILAHSLTLGGLHDLHRLPGLPGSADVPGGGDRDADHRGAGRARPHPGGAGREAAKTKIRGAPARSDRSRGGWRSITSTSRTRPASRCCTT